MAAGGYKEFVAGETLDQDEINDYLMQGVLVFAGTAARGSAIGTPVEGQFAFLKDSDALTFYDGSQWTELSTAPGTAVISGTTGSPTITNGTVISGTTYDLYDFTGDGSIILEAAGYVDIFAVGGGGCAGNSTSGAGGAGGFVEKINVLLPAGTSVVQVGAGGVQPYAGTTYNNGNPGESSYLGPVYAVGGGPGGAERDDAGNGASGGGGGSSGADNIGGGGGGLVIDSTQGNRGGDGQVGGNRIGGGGGGAGAAGQNGSSGGNGGNGSSTSITGTATTYAGGGGGGGLSGTAGTGGTGGGGNGSTSSAGTAGSANTGGGGGGGGANSQGASGGSGRVIVRVAV